MARKSKEEPTIAEGQEQDTHASMVRDEPMFPGGPVTADVALSEVENWERCGWKIAASS